MRPFSRVAVFAASASFALMTAWHAPSLASVVGTAPQPHGPSPESVQTKVTDEFYVFRPGTPGSFRYRDLELQVDKLYSYDLGLSQIQRDVLNLFADALADQTSTNSFALPMRHLELTYEYFRQPDRIAYDSDPFHLGNGFTTGPAITLGSYGAPSGTSVPPQDRSHVDYYLYKKYHPDETNTPQKYGTYPSLFAWAKEDSLTGHWHASGNDTIFHDNSVMYPGPDSVSVFTYPAAGGWNASNREADVLFCHEFQHSLRYEEPTFFGDGALFQMDEVFSTAAEALIGLKRAEPGDEVPYTWPIMQTNNYQNWDLLTDYLVFNFLGQDTSRTAAGITDDLVYQWSRGSRRFWDLGRLLTDQACYPCSQRSYFHPGGVALDPSSRLSLLLHNWRVANYVNNPTLAEGQYGFAGGFSPWDLKPWQSFANGTSDDAVALPPEVTARQSWATQDTTMVGYRYQTSGGTPLRYPMALEGYGAEYWVVRSDASLSQGAHDLVVRVTPEGIYRDWESPLKGRTYSIPLDGRLIASAVTYGQQDSLGAPAPLWRHPNWATIAIAPTWVDADSAAGALEFVIPNFGTATKAAVVVISLGDGPKEGLSRLGRKLAADTTTTSDYFDPGRKTLPYRLNLAIRNTPYQAQNPLPVAVTPTSAEDFATWSPAGDELAFAKYDPTSGYSHIYRRKLDGTAMSTLEPSPPAHHQSHPDWSPRGDVVAFDQDSTATQRNIWLYDPAAYRATRLTNVVGQASAPAFQPNGQRIAYVNYWQYSWLAPVQNVVPDFRCELRRVNLDGSGDQLVVGPTWRTIASPRWSADGSALYFTSSDTLYSVQVSNGTVAVVAGRNGDITSFDLPLSAGPLVIEQPGTYPYAFDPDTFQPDSSVAFRRIALRNRSSGDTQARFYRQGAQFFNPRWSFDGTRIAYSSDQNGPGERDVYVGQVSYNHAPLFPWSSGYTDWQVEQGQAFDRTLAATDADGETVTYAAAYLPPGASLDPTSGVFHWQVPANSAGQTYYVVFRALDPSGGVANRVARCDIIQGGGCPTVDTRTAAGWREENSILGRSLAGAPALDDYRLAAPPDTASGHVQLRIRENEAEVTALDQVRLIAVDHAPGLRSYAVGERVLVGSPVPAARVTRATGEDITALVNGGGGMFVGEPGETLTVVMNAPSGGFRVQTGEDGPPIIDDGGKDPPPQGGGRARPVTPESVENVDALIVGSTGMLVEVPDGAGGWRLLSRHYPRREFDEALLDTVSRATLRLVFIGHHRVRFIGRVMNPSEDFTATKLALTGATHSRLGDVLAQVAVAGNVTSTIERGDTLTLDFASPPLVPGQARDYFLLSSGLYTSNLPARQVPGEGAAPPLSFALLQNRPNPFTGGTTIGFELPAAARVRIDMFDLQGRQVRTLVDAAYAGGRWSVEWDRRDRAGHPVAGGIYLYRMEAGAFRAQRKMVLLP